MQHALSILSCALISSLSFAGSPVKWTFATQGTTDSIVQVTLTSVCEEGWHLYALTLPRDDGPFATVIRVTPSPSFELVGGIVEPQPIEVEDPNFQMLVRYHGHETRFLAPIRRLTPGPFTVEGEVEFMCCNDKMCLPPVTEKFSVQFPAVK